MASLRERLTDQMLSLIFHLKVLFWPLLALIEPLKGLPKRTFLKAFGVQLGLMVLWALLGGTLVGKLVWWASGGCAGNGGSFEGACGYAQIGNTVVAGYATAVIMTLLCGILLRIGIERKGDS